MAFWLLLVVACTCGSSPSPVRADLSADPTTAEDATDDFDPDDPEQGLFQRAPVAKQIEMLEALGYADGAEPAPSHSGVTVHADSLAPGRMLWTSGHAPEAYLMDLDGKVLHTWRMPYETLFGGKLHGEGRGRSYFRRVHAFDNGDLLAIFEAQGLVKLDRNSEVIWKLHDAVHHDLKIGSDGSIITLTRKAHINPVVNGKRPILEDYVARISPDGEVLKEVSVLNAVLSSDFADEWAPRKNSGDLFHTNAVVVLDGRWTDRLPEWKEGRVLVSVRAWHALMVIDLDSGKVVWVGKGDYRRQHDPRILNETLLVFDNLGLRNQSRVVELDPVTMSPVWTYQGTKEAPFFSRFCGANVRNPDGTTLISDSWAGRAFEVDAAGGIVWEFVSPHRAGDNDAFIAVIPEMIRLPETFGKEWVVP